MLKRLFDIQLFMNAFLFFLPARKSLIYVSGMPANGKVQRRQLRFAKRALGQRIFRMQEIEGIQGIQSAIDARQRALNDCRLDNLLDMTSLIMMRIDDAYVSNGAWLHVLIEIQRGTVLHLAPVEYLQSAYENVYMMKSHLHYDAVQYHRNLNKYAFRVVHALKNIRHHSIDRANLKIGPSSDAIVGILQNSSTWAPDLFPELKYSVGRLSNTEIRKNTSHASSFATVYASSAHRQSFHIPGRRWANRTYMRGAISRILRHLQEIEDIIASKSNQKYPRI